jgi:hypothetical protein
MLSTIDDVKAVAKKVWPDAITVNVVLAPSNTRTQKMYRVSAIGPDNLLLGRLDGPNLNKLKLLLEQRSTKRQLEGEDHRP